MKRYRLSVHLNSWKQKKVGATDLSDPKNTYTIKAIQKALGMAEDGQWTQTLMNRLQDYLMDSGDELDGSLKLTERNLETLFGADGIMEQTNEKTTEKPKLVGEYISEENYNEQSSAISRQVALNEKSTDVYARMLQMYQGNMDPEAVRMYEQAQAGYNRNLELQSKLQDMMDTLQSNRQLSSSAEKVEQNTYSSEIEAAAAFYSGGEMADTKKNKVEKTCIIIRVGAPIKDADGNITIQPRYMISKTFTGTYKYIGNEAMVYIAGLKAAGIEYSVAHTHPDMQGDPDPKKRTLDEIFSGLYYNNNIKDLFGDFTLNWLFGAKNIYMANERSNNIYRMDIQGPVMDPGKPGAYNNEGKYR